MLRDADRRDDLTLVHHIPVVAPYGRASLVFTVEITLRRGRQFLGTCREFPGYYVSGRSEHEVLMKMSLDIRRRLRALEP